MLSIRSAIFLIFSAMLW